jgi:hypothetical protein
LVELFDDIRLGSARPDCPVLVLTPVHDQIIAVQDIDAQVERYNDFGADVTYIRDRLSEHLSLMVLSVPTVLRWLDDRFEGVPAPSGSTRTVWSTALSTSSLRGFVSMGLVALKTLTGRSLVKVS